jgi:DNA-binding MarR family transcriptional regulator
MNESPRLSPSSVQCAREVRTVIGRVRRRLLKAAEPEDMTLAQTSVLTSLSGKEGATASELAAAEGVRHQSMTSTIAALSALGLVERRPDPEDGRRLLIALTEEGHRRVDGGRQARNEWLAGELQEKCTESERRALIAAMAILERVTHD